MSLLQTFDISGSAMAAQSVRLNTIASNLANAQSVAENREDTYRARHPVFSEALRNQFGTQPSLPLEAGGAVGSKVLVTGILESSQPLNLRYEPAHPFADEGGYVAYPNVNAVQEMADMIAASRAFQINVEVMNTTRTLAERVLSLGQ